MYLQQIECLQKSHKDERESMNERIREMERHMDSMLNQNQSEKVGIDGLNQRLQDMSAYINHIK
jgi:hypothetical protein